MVNDLKIQPSEAWGLDFVEINKLINQEQKQDDLSVMLNFERKLNGATKEWLQSH